MTGKSLQEQIPDNHCYGCGPLNERGLTLRSYWSGSGRSTARFAPQAHHCAGPTHFVNGGIISTLIDCHCVCTATAAAYVDEGRPIGSEPHHFFATTKLAVEFLRPTPIYAELLLEAEVVAQIPHGYRLSCTLSAQGKARVTGTVEAVRVSPAWMTPGKTVEESR